jgi:hypothetical protein
LSAPGPSVQIVDIGHGGGIDVEVGEGGLWVTTRDGVLEIDPTTNEFVKDIALDGAFRLATGEGAVWVTDLVRGGLVRIDPDTGAVVSMVEVSQGAHDCPCCGGLRLGDSERFGRRAPDPDRSHHE